ncbi:hypothetical protein K474DRAFT_1744981 [Panus rudis PR-1116 ss-1]|nr:hypothetical protein K474DRAFT_1744981 [Panus rudis PR-1116 ss-1]
MLHGSEEQAAVGIAGSDYAARTRKLITLITDLRALGAQADFDLPRIAVIGNQSAGKSSLVEAISGITVPRASGTCTRCPMECRLTHTDHPWRCQVLLRWEHDAKGQKVKTREDKFGDVLTDKSELEERLRRAQTAILNPSTPAIRFLTGTIPEDPPRELQFSSNVVCIDISGPDVTDLSFIDLPGLISNVAPGEDRSSIDAVRNMVREHIQGNTLILLTITMRDDIDNQGAADLAHSEDPEGARTIGVLTKPDLIQYGEENAWVAILEGRRHFLKHGYFVTKQPSPKELEELITFPEARAREQYFFANESPWKGLASLRDRMGTPNLTKELSRLLGAVINQALPDLRKSSKESHDELKELLARLPPPPPDNPAAKLLNLVTEFAHDIEHLVRGDENFEALIQNCRPAYHTLQIDIRSTAPNFRPFTDADEEDKFKDSLEERVTEDEDQELTMSSIRETAPIYLGEVRRHIERSLTRELPFNVPFRAKISLIRRFYEEWENHSLKCFEQVLVAAQQELTRLVDHHFGMFNSTSLLDHVQTIVEDQIEECRHKTQQRIRWMLELEDPPFTLNTHYFSSYREKYLSSYKANRKGSSESMSKQSVQAALSALANIGYEGLKAEDLFKLHGSDAYEEEMTVMAETAAYFHVSYKRIIDNIPRIIDHDFLHSIAKHIQGSLIEKLALGTEASTERASTYLAEDEQTASTRQNYIRKKERLEAVLKRLFNFGL